MVNMNARSTVTKHEASVSPSAYGVTCMYQPVLLRVSAQYVGFSLESLVFSSDDREPNFLFHGYGYGKSNDLIRITSHVYTQVPSHGTITREFALN
jgi:hypothetical protein